jgi:ATP-binding cassette subfamily A (ABC1) protein 3
LCNGNDAVTAQSLGSISRYGGPILYLFLYALILLGILVWVDSGALFHRKLGKRKTAAAAAVAAVDGEKQIEDEVKNDDDGKAEVALDRKELLRVLGATKTFGKDKVVDDVSLVVSQDTVFALLGPNGAGKTTTFNMIREFPYLIYIIYNDIWLLCLCRRRCDT